MLTGTKLNNLEIKEKKKKTINRNKEGFLRIHISSFHSDFPNAI